MITAIFVTIGIIGLYGVYWVDKNYPYSDDEGFTYLK